MTHPDNDISEIRRLLALYYDGVATPAQQQALVDFFAGVTDAASLPDDMQADAYVFRAMSDARNIPAPPDSLDRDLESAIDRLAIAEHTRRRPLVWWSLSVAAAAIIALVMITPLARYDASSELGPSLATARTAVADSKDTTLTKPAPQSEAHPAELIVKERRQPDSAVKMPKHYRHPRHSASTLQSRHDEGVSNVRDRKKDNCVRIDDPQKAAAIAGRAIRSFALATRIANAGIETVNASYNDIENLLTKVQYESD